MEKENLFFKKIKKIITLSLCVVMVSSSLTACGSEPSAFKQDFESSGYKKVSIYKEYGTKYSDFSNFEKNHGYLAMSSENGGTNVLFKGFYQMKSVHIGTQDATEAFKTNTVKEFAEICGYKDYEDMINNSLFKCTSNELFNHNDYVVYFEKLDTGGADLYLGKKFEYTFENDEVATSVFNDVLGLLSQDEYDKFDYEQLKDEYGNINENMSIPYAIVLGIDSQEENVVKKDELVGDTNYNYNIYLKMEEYLLSLDKDCADVLEKSKNGDDSKTPQF